MEDTKPLAPPLSKARRVQIAESIARKREAKGRTLEMLERFRKDIAPGRDAELVKACLRIRAKIVELKQKWVPQFLFTQMDGPLFHIEGTSEATLYNYIPCTDKNVYVVYERNIVVNFTGLMTRLKNWSAVDIPTDCEFVCNNVRIFGTDLVSTRDPLLAELFAERIDFYSKYTR